MNWFGADTLLQGGRNKRSRPIANNTRVERIDDDTIGIKLHDTYVVTIFRDGSYELNTGGWYTVTTKARINEYAPVRLGSDHGRWMLFGRDWTKVGPFFDGIRVDSEGAILNPRPQDDEERVERETRDTYKAISKYAAAYIEAAKQQIYVDALYASPEGAISCWDCSMPTMAGRTTEGGDATLHLRRHVENNEFPPALIYTALKAKGAGPYYFQTLSLGSGNNLVDMSRTSDSMIPMFRRWIRDYLKSQLLDVTGRRPFVDYSAKRNDMMGSAGGHY